MGMRLLTRFLAIGLAGLLLASCAEEQSSNESKAKPDAGAKIERVAKAVANKKTSQKGFSREQEEAIARIVRQTLVSRPEIIQEAIVALQQKEKAQEAKRKISALSDNAETLYRSKFDPVAGNPDGDVTVVEFFDYNCPYCRKGFKTLEKVVKQDKNIRVVFKEFPIFGNASLTAARAALASKEQGKYYVYHKALLEADGRLTDSSVFTIARQVGLDIDRLRKDMESPEVAQSIGETKDLANRLGITGTPAYYVGDKFIGGVPPNLSEVMKRHASDIRKNGCKIC
ncbi:MAG: thioredoxin domain-containing protein [bacterium]|nr:thioredoxin domain-containing protein [bacterium]